MYKENFKKLMVGQKIKLKVVEADKAWIIVSYKGELLRVSNKTEKYFKENEEIQLLVKKVSPIEFAMPSGKGFSVWA